jgi:ligand-binding SRPBCC domain-containing protein
MRYQFSTAQWLPYPVELVFAFFANPENLPRLMPRWQKAHIEEANFAPPPPRPEGAPRYPGMAAGNNTRLLITARPFPYSPLRLPWEACIEDFRWNQGFCDVQLRGPFRYWRHCHTVTAAPSPDTGQPGTLLRDEVAYELPLGLGPWADNLVARRAFNYTFNYRHRRTKEILALITKNPLPTKQNG